MFRPRTSALFGALLALAAPAAAQTPMSTVQTGPQLPYSRFAITPFFGVRAPLTTGSTIVVLDSANAFEARYERGAAAMFGAEAEYRVLRQWSVVGALAFSQRGSDVLRSIATTGDTLFFTGSGTSVMFARLGAQYRIPDPQPDVRRFHPGGFVSASPAWVRMKRPGGETVDNVALNLGMAATALIGSSRRLGFQIGLEDYITFLNTDRLEEVDAVTFPNATSGTVVEYRYNTSNIIALRFGASYRI